MVLVTVVADAAVGAGGATADDCDGGGDPHAATDINGNTTAVSNVTCEVGLLGMSAAQ